jgi:hypothetical protein
MGAVTDDWNNPGGYIKRADEVQLDRDAFHVNSVTGDEYVPGLMHVTATRRWEVEADYADVAMGKVGASLNDPHPDFGGVCTGIRARPIEPIESAWDDPIQWGAIWAQNEERIKGTLGALGFAAVWVWFHMLN